MKKDLLGIGDLSTEEIYRILDTAEAMREIGERPIKKVPTLRGKTVVNLFYEPSTRTRTSPGPGVGVSTAATVRTSRAAPFFS